MTESTENPKQVLVIDDDAVLLQALDRILREEGYNVCLAADGVQGMALLREVKPDLVLLDIKMPGPDGHLTLDRIRQESDVPVVMVTVDRDPNSLRKAFALGANDYISKPFKVKELVARVRSKMGDNLRPSNQN